MLTIKKGKTSRMIIEKFNMKDHKQDVSAWMKNSGIRIKKFNINHKAFF